MIDNVNNGEKSADRLHPASGTRPAAAAKATDLYGQLYRDVRTPAKREAPATAPADRIVMPLAGLLGAVPAPLAPSTLQESGLSAMQVCDLILKQLYVQGSLVGMEIAGNTRLPFAVIDEVLRFLKNEKCIEVSSGEVIGPVTYRFNLTELGRVRAREAFEQCRYVGPAPVSLEAYAAQCRRQGVNEAPCTPESLIQAFDDMVVSDRLLDELGPAVCSGQSIFIYGPPGNGKTMIAKGLGRFLNSCGGEIYVPYAIHTEGSVITVFDPTVHNATDHGELPGADASGKHSVTNLGYAQSSQLDFRWRRIRRPVIITGGELTLAMLDLRYSTTSNFYQAPLHIKANGGVFLIDDFGRQIVSPRDLLNRWILPLQERTDYLTLITGKNMAVPFEQLTIFSTNLDPKELADEAFLRRIRHKIRVDSPGNHAFTEIFRFACDDAGIAFTPAAADYLISKYEAEGTLPRASDPRDLLEIMQSICRFRKQEVRLTEELMEDAASRFFCRL